jgi:hypothetical protein
VGDASDENVVQLDDQILLLIPTGFALVIVASFRCLPVAQASMSRGDALSTLWTMDRSGKVGLPVPTPVAPPLDALVTPHENERTSILSLCLASCDSPLMSPIFAKIPRDEAL